MILRVLERGGGGDGVHIEGKKYNERSCKRLSTRGGGNFDFGGCCAGAASDVLMQCWNRTWKMASSLDFSDLAPLPSGRLVGLSQAA
jgi:hypothetical protein